MFYERGWTDGLPVIPPTAASVSRMLSSRDPGELVAILPPRGGEATLEKIAINAVMAGCLPEYLPVIIAAVEALAEERFNLAGVQATTHPCTPLLIINGPVARRLGVNGRGNAFGPGVRANAAIGRAIRLIMLNIGGGVPGQVSKTTQGSPARFTYCAAENEVDSPWPALHAERGFQPGESAVTVFAAEPPHNINDHLSITAEGILTTAAATMATAGNNNLMYLLGEPVLILGPEHAATIARDGFSKEQVKDFIFERARLPLGRLAETHIAFRKECRNTFGEFADAESVPVARRKDIVVLVIGGEGKHSSFAPTFGASQSVTKPVRDWYREHK
ncbi:MAG: hypothetical protein HYX96_05995 [Chloroflexi bacterium]|nr:hypothetical protein [Chloroflexota bacterium]